MNINGKKVTKAYFIGIGGIGMSGLAQLLADQGVSVSGSDREESPTTELLRSRSIHVVLVQDGTGVPDDADIAIYSEAVWADNKDRVKVKELGIPELSYFAMLGEVSKEKRTIAISGTHGKTTTTGMTAAVLKGLGLSPTAIVGSIVKDFGSNYMHGDSDLFVLESCEYKRDFLSLYPSILVITNLEWDHTDYYKDVADVQSAFRELAKRVPEGGAIITDASHPNIKPVIDGLNTTIIDYRAEGGSAYELLLPGDFNQSNAQAAVAVARFIAPSADLNEVRNVLSTFHGTWRRFDYRGKTAQGADVYDDYAHHPTAIRKTLAEIRKKTSGKVYVAFHPHLYSRTRDLLEEFATAFVDADGVFVAPIYPAREIDDGSISSEILAKRISENGTSAEAKIFAEIQEALTTYPTRGDTVVTMGAGDIYKVAENLTNDIV